MYVLEPSIHKNKPLEFSNFGHICQFFFNLTYTQVNLLIQEYIR
jgi:hypothetical protein